MGEILDFLHAPQLDRSRGTDEISHTLLLNDFGTSKVVGFFGDGG